MPPLINKEKIFSIIFENKICELLCLLNINFIFITFIISLKKLILITLYLYLLIYLSIFIKAQIILKFLYFLLLFCIGKMLRKQMSF